MSLPRWVPITLGIATAGPYALFGGLGPDEHLAPWLAAAAGWATWMVVVRYGIVRGWWLGPKELTPEGNAEASAYLKLLALSPSFTRDDVQREFRRQAKLHHPDVAGGDAAAFRELVEAKEHALEELGT